MFPEPEPKAGDARSRLFVYNDGFLTQRRLRRILSLAGYDIRLGLPGPDDVVGVWGNSPTAHRGLAVAAKREAPALRVEDAFLRSLHPGRSGTPPMGLLLDRAGVHFDPSTPSDLDHLLTTHPLDDTALLDRARGGIARLREMHLSKYSAFDPNLPPPDPGYVLVVDQTRDDAAVTASGGNRARFLEMLFIAQEENPGARILIKTHPETQSGHRAGYYTDQDLSDRVSFLHDPISPWALLDGAIAVYTLSSQLGFEAILAGHKPRVFGQPFYAGWGLTQEETPLPRRQRNLTRAQLFAAAMILFPTWYDPYRDQLCTFETALDNFEAQTRAWRADHKGWTASGMRLWKRPHLQKMFGQHRRVRFTAAPPEPATQPHMIWASRASDTQDAVRVEDGFLRSRGLGAQLVPPLSLVTDDLGIYYDPTRPSRLEELIAARETLRPDQQRRAERLVASLLAQGLSKYNTGGAAPTLPEGHRILVPGQVEDDASILKGTSDVRTNLDLLRAARAANPDAVLIYKPHPDVEAGLREGGVDAADLADVIAHDTDPAALLSQVNEAWTMTSLLGFEALLRGVPVTTLGAPFYAGWNLTTDLGAVPARRGARPSLLGLVHAALIDYPRYLDPVTGQPCPVEVIIDRLAQGHAAPTGATNRVLSKLQGLLASRAHWWR
ncbi:capsular polysaccharide biosynthesis protein [Ruegeria sp.]|uniref:capsular polysaccharide biosynthesis protein n=1 Tax=Ruegeria sp. TaxID=1879320 RepID=UPI00230F45F4|nr:capsular polysaccharide biosynthesis protein [Ruegeria sp.]MDA7963311.1 capsular polysaccharide biosynthesis protein [Ruegeria sp.]